MVAGAWHQECLHKDKPAGSGGWMTAGGHLTDWEEVSVIRLRISLIAEKIYEILTKLFGILSPIG